MIPNLSVHGHVGVCGEKHGGSHDEQPIGDHGDVAEVALEVVVKISDAAS